MLSRRILPFTLTITTETRFHGLLSEYSSMRKTETITGMVYMYSGSPIDTIYVSANGKQTLDRIPDESPSSQHFSPEV